MAIFDLKAFARKLLGTQPVAAADTSITPSTLSTAGFDTAIFNQIDGQISAGHYGVLHSLLIVYGNRLIAEKYYNGWEKDKIHDIQSVTKSVTSLLIGIAIDKGYIRSVNEKLSVLLPNMLSTDDTLKRSIRLKDLLSMSAGIAWTEQTRKYNEPGNSLTDMYSRNVNFVDYILSLDMAHEPGTRFNYSSGASILLGAILQAKTGMPVAKFAEKYLFHPLGIEKYHWAEYFDLAHCGGGLYLNSMDLIRIGALVLNAGNFNGKQVVSRKWISESLKPRFGAGNKTYYAYHWWMIGSIFDLQPIVFAAGNGWQFIFVIREFNMVIVTTGHNYSEQEPKTTFSQHELVYSLLSANPAFRARITKLYDDDNDTEVRNLYEILLMAQALNTQGQYSKSASYLQRVDAKYGNDLRFCGLLGEAYYHIGEKERSKTYLLRCVELSQQQQLPEPGYQRNAEKILALMDRD